MTAYYNEHDEFAADWLRNLIAAGLIADGEVDTRSIVDVRPGDLRGFDQCHFFAGIGGWSYALRQAGWDDASPVWTGSCPCQPFSLAGAQRGFDDERHLWPVWRELIRECSPAIVFGEQVASATAWLGLVRGDLETMGYAVGAIPMEAASAGADHLRDRYWFVGDDQSERRREGWAEHEVRSGRATSSVHGGVEYASLIPEREPHDETDAKPNGWQTRPVFGGSGYHSDAMANADGSAIRIEPGRRSGPHGAGAREHSEVCLADADELGTCEERQQRSGQQRGSGGDQEAFAWVVGSDGKARRVKPGIRLLAHGVPNRVGLLRGFGNAIDHRPAAAFIAAARESLALSSHKQGPSDAS